MKKQCIYYCNQSEKQIFCVGTVSSMQSIVFEDDYKKTLYMDTYCKSAKWCRACENYKNISERLECLGEDFRDDYTYKDFIPKKINKPKLTISI